MLNTEKRKSSGLKTVATNPATGPDMTPLPQREKFGKGHVAVVVDQTHKFPGVKMREVQAPVVVVGTTPAPARPPRAKPANYLDFSPYFDTQFLV